MNGAAVGTIVPNYDKMFSQAPKGLLCKALVHAVRLLYHKFFRKEIGSIEAI